MQIDYNPINVISKNDSLNLILNEIGGTRISVKNIEESKIDVLMKVSSGMNVVSSMYLTGNLGDQVNFNVVQNNNVNKTIVIETNFYYRDIVKYDVNAKFIDEERDVTDDYNKYSIIFLKDSYEYLLNDKSVRKINRNEIENFPDNINELKISIWEASPSLWGGSGININTTIEYETKIKMIKVECLNNNNNVDMNEEEEEGINSNSNVNEIGLVLSISLMISLVIFF